MKLKQKEDDLKITLTPLEPVPLSATQLELNKAIGNRLPEIALAEVLLELNARTGFVKNGIKMFLIHQRGSVTRTKTQLESANCTKRTENRGVLFACLLNMRK